MNKKAVLLFSGGLDSILSYHLLKPQGIDILLIRFITPFFNPKLKNFPSGSRFKEIQLGKEYLEIIRKPKYGFGKHLNPCIDCKIFMFKKARQIMREESASFLITGEILGQRPMSQKKHIFNLMEKESNLKGFVLRPLCAKLLKQTTPEARNLVDRNKLLDIQGRSRKRQLELASVFKITNYFTPSGGCLLTDKGFSERFKDLINSKPDYSLEDIELLKTGRHFRLSSDEKLIISRDEKEAKVLLDKSERYIVVKSPFIEEPVGLFTSGNQDNLALGLEIFSSYLYKRLKNRKETIAILYHGKAREIIEIDCKTSSSLMPL